MNNNNVRNFLNKRKVWIISAGAVVTGLGLCVIGIKAKFSLKNKVDMISNLNKGNVEIPVDFKVGDICELWTEEDGEWLNAIVNDLTTEDLGRLGEEFVKTGIVPKESKVSVVIGFTK